MRTLYLFVLSFLLSSSVYAMMPGQGGHHAHHGKGGGHSVDKRMNHLEAIVNSGGSLKPKQLAFYQTMKRTMPGSTMTVYQDYKVKMQALHHAKSPAERKAIVASLQSNPAFQMMKEARKNHPKGKGKH